MESINFICDEKNHIIMKKFFLSAAFLLLSVLAFAQFNDTAFSGNLKRHNGGLRLDGIDLTREEQALLLSDVNGQDLNEEWSRLRGKRALGEGLIIGGAATAGAGAVVFVGTGVVWVLVAAIGGGIAGAVSGGDSDAAQGAVDNISEAFAPWFIGSGVVTGLGVAAVGAGIPIKVVNAKKMDAIVDDWNNSKAAPEVSLNFGAAPSGVGFTLNF